MMMPCYGSLVNIKKDGSEGAELRVTKNEITFGSLLSCDVRLTISGVEETHCTLLVHPNSTAVLRNFSTRNPVQVNGEPILKNALLQDGDRISILDKTFMWHCSIQTVDKTSRKSIAGSLKSPGRPKNSKKRKSEPIYKLCAVTSPVSKNTDNRSPGSSSERLPPSPVLEVSESTEDTVESLSQNVTFRRRVNINEAVVSPRRSLKRTRKSILRSAATPSCNKSVRFSNIKEGTPEHAIWKVPRTPASKSFDASALSSDSDSVSLIDLTNFTDLSSDPQDDSVILEYLSTPAKSVRSDVSEVVTPGNASVIATAGESSGKSMLSPFGSQTPGQFETLKLASASKSLISFDTPIPSAKSTAKSPGTLGNPSCATGRKCSSSRIQTPFKASSSKGQRVSTDKLGTSSAGQSKTPKLLASPKLKLQKAVAKPKPKDQTPNIRTRLIPLKKKQAPITPMLDLAEVFKTPGRKGASTPVSKESAQKIRSSTSKLLTPSTLSSFNYRSTTPRVGSALRAKTPRNKVQVNKTQGKFFAIDYSKGTQRVKARTPSRPASQFKFRTPHEAKVFKRASIHMKQTPATVSQNEEDSFCLPEKNQLNESNQVLKSRTPTSFRTHSVSGGFKAKTPLRPPTTPKDVATLRTDVSRTPKPEPLKPSNRPLSQSEALVAKSPKLSVKTPGRTTRLSSLVEVVVVPTETHTTNTKINQALAEPQVSGADFANKDLSALLKSDKLLQSPPSVLLTRISVSNATKASGTPTFTTKVKTPTATPQVPSAKKTPGAATPSSNAELVSAAKVKTPVAYLRGSKSRASGQSTPNVGEAESLDISQALSDVFESPTSLLGGEEQSSGASGKNGTFDIPSQADGRSTLIDDTTVTMENTNFSGTFSVSESLPSVAPYYKLTVTPESLAGDTDATYDVTYDVTVTTPRETSKVNKTADETSERNVTSKLSRSYRETSSGRVAETSTKNVCTPGLECTSSAVKASRSISSKTKMNTPARTTRNSTMSNAVINLTSDDSEFSPMSAVSYKTPAKVSCNTTSAGLKTPTPARFPQNQGGRSEVKNQSIPVIKINDEVLETSVEDDTLLECESPGSFQLSRRELGSDPHVSSTSSFEDVSKPLSNTATNTSRNSWLNDQSVTSTSNSAPSPDRTSISPQARALNTTYSPDKENCKSITGANMTPLFTPGTRKSSRVSKVMQNLTGNSVDVGSIENKNTTFKTPISGIKTRKSVHSTRKTPAQIFCDARTKYRLSETSLVHENPKLPTADSRKSEGPSGPPKKQAQNVSATDNVDKEASVIVIFNDDALDYEEAFEPADNNQDTPASLNLSNVRGRQTITPARSVPPRKSKTPAIQVSAEAEPSSIESVPSTPAQSTTDLDAGANSDQLVRSTRGSIAVGSTKKTPKIPRSPVSLEESGELKETDPTSPVKHLDRQLRSPLKQAVSGERAKTPAKIRSPERRNSCKAASNAQAGTLNDSVIGAKSPELNLGSIFATPAKLVRQGPKTPESTDSNQSKIPGTSGSQVLDLSKPVASTPYESDTKFRSQASLTKSTMKANFFNSLLHRVKSPLSEVSVCHALNQSNTMIVKGDKGITSKENFDPKVLVDGAQSLPGNSLEVAMENEANSSGDSCLFSLSLQEPSPPKVTRNAATSFSEVASPDTSVRPTASVIKTKALSVDSKLKAQPVKSSAVSPMLLDKLFEKSRSKLQSLTPKDSRSKKVSSYVSAVLDWETGEPCDTTVLSPDTSFFDFNAVKTPGVPADVFVSPLNSGGKSTSNSEEEAKLVQSKRRSAKPSLRKSKSRVSVSKRLSTESLSRRSGSLSKRRSGSLKRTSLSVRKKRVSNPPAPKRKLRFHPDVVSPENQDENSEDDSDIFVQSEPKTRKSQAAARTRRSTRQKVQEEEVLEVKTRKSTKRASLVVEDKPKPTLRQKKARSKAAETKIQPIAKKSRQNLEVIVPEAQPRSRKSTKPKVQFNVQEEEASAEEDTMEAHVTSVGGKRRKAKQEDVEVSPPKRRRTRATLAELPEEVPAKKRTAPKKPQDSVPRRKTRSVVPETQDSGDSECEEEEAIPSPFDRSKRPTRAAKAGKPKAQAQKSVTSKRQTRSVQAKTPQTQTSEPLEDEVVQSAPVRATRTKKAVEESAGPEPEAEKASGPKKRKTRTTVAEPEVVETLPTRRTRGGKAVLTENLEVTAETVEKPAKKTTAKAAAAKKTKTGSEVPKETVVAKSKSKGSGLGNEEEGAALQAKTRGRPKGRKRSSGGKEVKVTVTKRVTRSRK